MKEKKELDTIIEQFAQQNRDLFKEIQAIKSTQKNNAAGTKYKFKA